MGLFHRKAKDTLLEPVREQKIYIRDAGGSVVSRSILDGSSKLKWLFRQESEHGNGWVAFGDTDTQDYVNDARNMAIVDFNTLVNIEPAAANVFWLPPGSDLELREDGAEKYFVDTRTGQEYRDPVKHPLQAAFERNLKFLNQPSYPVGFFQALFTEGPRCRVLLPGEADFSTGEVVLADPLAYLGGSYETVLERRIPAGCYPVELSVCLSQIAGPRIAAARLVLREDPAVRYEIAMPKGKQPADLGKPGVFTFFGVDMGLACFADKRFSEDYRDFRTTWEREHSQGNLYADYFDDLFRAFGKGHPEFLEERILPWALPGSGERTVLFSSGMGDGIYSGYWGLDEAGEPVSLTAVFMNPEYF